MRWEVVYSVSSMVSVGLILLLHFRKRKSSTDIPQALAVLSDTGLDYSSCLKDMYYFGYLIMVLPPSVSNEGGIVQSIRNYILEHDLYKCKDPFPEKLFLVTTRSGFTPPDFSLKRGRIIRHTTINLLSADRGGISKRKYDSGVYKVLANDGTRSARVVMEGIPCLIQVAEAAERNQYINHQRDYIIQAFLRKLKDQLDSNEGCRGKFEIIFLQNKEFDRNELADAIWKRIESEVSCRLVSPSQIVR